jgi:hypothetical protein
MEMKAKSSHIGLAMSVCQSVAWLGSWMHIRVAISVRPSAHASVRSNTGLAMPVCQSVCPYDSTRGPLGLGIGRIYCWPCLFVRMFAHSSGHIGLAVIGLYCKNVLLFSFSW